MHKQQNLAKSLRPIVEVSEKELLSVGQINIYQYDYPHISLNRVLTRSKRKWMIGVKSR
jgi:hypothetical protein